MPRIKTGKVCETQWVMEAERKFCETFKNELRRNRTVIPVRMPLMNSFVDWVHLKRPFLSFSV